MIEFPHQRARRGKGVSYKNKEGLVRLEFDTFANDKDELTESEVSWYQEFFLVDRRQRLDGIFGSLDYTRNASGKFLANASRLVASYFKGITFTEVHRTVVGRAILVTITRE